MTFQNIIKFVISILICQLAGFVGSLFTTPSIPAWYRDLTKPSFTPPNWLFSPVWITLFVLMGVSAFLVWQKGWRHPHVQLALIIFCLQLALNVLWSFLFFKLQQPMFAFIEILCLWLAILLSILSFLRVSKLASYLLFPYLLWVSFAAVLNFSIWRLNP